MDDGDTTGAAADRTRAAYRVAYDGRDYHGFQRQPTVATVEGHLLDTLVHLGLIDDPTTPPAGYAAAGRTDAGVSAMAQTVAFDAPEWLTASTFSAPLPDDIVVWARTPVAEDFHARYDATRRVYTYYLPTSRSCEAHLRHAVAVLRGYHDFHNLTPDDRLTRRRVAIDVTRADGWWRLDFTASGFPRQFVRRCVSVVRAVASGERTPAHLGDTLSATSLPDHHVSPPASPTPLVLRDVTYPDVAFSIDSTARDRLESTLGPRREEALAGAKVLGVICSLDSDSRL